MKLEVAKYFRTSTSQQKQTELNRSATWHRICAVFQQDPHKVQTSGMTSFFLVDAGALVRSGLHVFRFLKDPRFSSYDHTPIWKMATPPLCTTPSYTIKAESHCFSIRFVKSCFFNLNWLVMVCHRLKQIKVHNGPMM